MSVLAIEPPAHAAPRYPRLPVLVLVAFYLWWPLIIGQSIMLAYLALTLAQAARIGGPAWDILFVDPPIAVPLLLLITLEIAFALAMRGGSHVARVVLLVLAAVNTAFAFLVGIPVNGTRMPVVQTTAEVMAASVSVDLTLILKLLSVTALAGSLLPFLPPARRHFWKPPSMADSAPTGDPTTRPAEARVRRKMPWQVLLAFILWWPLIILEAAGLVLLGMNIAQYIGSGMASALTLLAVVGIGLPLLAMIAAETTLVFFLRRGSRAARGWLLSLAIPTVLLTAWPGVVVLLAAIGSTQGGLGGGEFIAQVSAIGAAVAALALVAGVLPFLPPGKGYFATPPSDTAPTGSTNPTGSPTDPGSDVDPGNPSTAGAPTPAPPHPPASPAG